MLAGSGLTLWRGTTCLFEELSFTVPAGAALLVEGPNGAGKTTLLRVIAGLTMPEAGAVTWNGQSCRKAVEAGHLGIAFSGHALSLKGELTTRENLEFFATLAGEQGRLSEMLEVMGLSGCAGLDVRLLSAGQKRRAGLARVLLSNAGLWLLDEPQTNLDSDGRQALEAAIRSHVGRGGTVVVAAHLGLELGPAPVGRLRLGEAA